MSPPAMKWVFSESPYRGAFFALHLAIADRVNDGNGYELWESIPNLAKKARISERHAREGIAQMVADGLLVDPVERRGAPTRYRFVMPDNPCTTRTPAVSSPLQPAAPTPALSSETPATTAETPALSSPELKNGARTERRTQGAWTLVGFDAFWRAYPIHEGERDAKKAWQSAIHRANPADIIAGAHRLAADPNREDRYTKSPAKWLEGDHWKDEPRRQGRQRAKGTAQVLSWLGAEPENERKELHA